MSLLSKSAVGCSWRLKSGCFDASKVVEEGGVMASFLGVPAHHGAG
jgi:hypothetical protein